MVFTESPCHSRKVFSSDDDISTVYLAKTGDNSLGRYFSLVHAKSSGPMFNEQAYLGESARVKEIVYSLSDCPLTSFMALFNHLGVGYLFDFGSLPFIFLN